MVFAVLTIDRSFTNEHRNDVRFKWQEQADSTTLNVQALILQNMQTVWGLAANVSVDPEINESRFVEIAQVIYELAPELKNIGLAPDLVIRHIYPLKGNQAALGLDLTKQSLPPEDIQQLLETRRALFHGPFNLVQGGKGLAGRIPIFEAENGDFWGVVSVILDMDKLYRTAGFRELRRNFNFVLSASTDPYDADAIFFGTRSPEWTNPVSSRIRMSGVTWTLFAEPLSGWPSAPRNATVFRSTLILAALIICVAVFWLTRLLIKERETQAQLSGLFELAPIGIGLFHAENRRLLMANPTFHRQFGEEARSLAFFEQGYDAFGVPLQESASLHEELNTKSRISGFQTYYPTPDGDVAPVMLQGLKLHDIGSTPVIWLISEDISEQKKVERLKNEFISTVSHELRTPLTSISGSLGLLANDATDSLPEKSAKLIRIAHRNSQQLTFLINDLLDIDKLAAGKMQFKMEKTPIAELVGECVENISNYAREKHIDVDVSPLPEVSVSVDRKRLEQALNNLLSNAIKFSHENGTVVLFAQQMGPKVRICVRDYGIGVPTEFQGQIFEKFSQADSSSRRTKGGTGLGLAITRELMKNMGGSVDYESTPGKGATFWLELPVVSDATR